MGDDTCTANCLSNLPPPGVSTYGVTESVTAASASNQRPLPQKMLASGGPVGQSRGIEE
jgi:hypothetical protein